MVGESFRPRIPSAMSLAASKARLVWILLCLTLFQAWGAVLHVHEPVAGTGVSAPLVALAQAAGIDATESAPDGNTAEAECHCLWCAPRLHAVLAIAMLLCIPLVLAQYRHPFTPAAGFRPKPRPRGAVPPPRGPPV